MAATIAIATLTTVIAPERIAEIEIARIGRCTDRCTGDTADHRAGTGTTRNRTDGRTGTRADQATRHRTIARRRAATTKDKSRRQKCACSNFVQEHSSLRCSM
jgi:hypothetical protein